MSTAVKAPPELVELRCCYAAGMYVLEASEDAYDNMGRRRPGRRGRVIKFSGGWAQVPAEWMDEVEERAWFGVEVFRADDVRAPKPDTGPRVAEGSVSVADRTKAPPPLADWTTAGPRELRERIPAGEVRDPVAALTYEAQGKRREQVMTALSQRIARGKGDAEPTTEPEAGPEAFSAEVPAGAKGV